MDGRGRCKDNIWFEDNNIDLRFETVVEDLIIEDDIAKGVKVRSSKSKDTSLEEIYGKNVVVAVGRKGANWLVNMCEKKKKKNRGWSSRYWCKI